MESMYALAASGRTYSIVGLVGLSLRLLWDVVRGSTVDASRSDEDGTKAPDASVAVPLPIDKLADDDLVRLAQRRGKKDDRPFRELVRRHQRMVWRVCYGFVNNADDAEDLTQDVFYKAYRNIGRFEGRSSFKTWIYRIAINTSQNELRRRARRPQPSDLTIDDAAEFLPSSVSLTETLHLREERRLLVEAFSRLRPQEVEVIRLKDLEDYSYIEIAEMLEIGVSAAKMRVQRARLALRYEYQRLVGPEAEQAE